MDLLIFNIFLVFFGILYVVYSVTKWKKTDEWIYLAYGIIFILFTIFWYLECLGVS